MVKTVSSRMKRVNADSSDTRMKETKQKKNTNHHLAITMAPLLQTAPPPFEADAMHQSRWLMV